MRQHAIPRARAQASDAGERSARSRVQTGATAATPSMAPHVDPVTESARSGSTQQEFVMQINVKGHQVEVTEALNNYAIGKFERVTRVFDQLHDVSIVLGVEKLLHKAEVTMQLSGKTLHADATATDMYAAIDVLVDKVETQLRKHKEKLTDHHADAVRAARYN